MKIRRGLRKLITTQADIANRQVNKTTNKQKACVVIIADDSKRDLITNNFVTVLASHTGAKMDIALNPDHVGTDTYLTQDDITTLKANTQIGWLNHGWNHQEPLNLTLAQLQANKALEKAKFIELGIGDVSDYYVYAGATASMYSNADLKNRLRNAGYKCCFSNVDAKDNYFPIDIYEIRRQSLFSSDYAKYIDFAVANNSLCVLFFHPWMTGQTDSNTLNTVLTYIDGLVSQGKIEYASAKDIIDNYALIYDNGNGVTGSDYFRFDENGNVGFSIGGRDVHDAFNGLEALEDMIFVSTTPWSDLAITEYPIHSVTYSNLIDNAVATALGLPDIASVITVRNYDSSRLSGMEYLEYEIFHVSNGTIWKRHWIPSLTVWSVVYPISSVSCTSTTRPRYAPNYAPAFDTSLATPRPIWPTGGQYTPNTALARNKALKKWDVFDRNSGTALWVCVVAGTTAASEPSIDYAAGHLTVDGTATYLGLGTTKAVWKDAAGTAV